MTTAVTIKNTGPYPVRVHIQDHDDKGTMLKEVCEKELAPGEEVEKTLWKGRTLRVVES